MEHSAKLSKDGATQQNLTDLAIDAGFELAPAPVETIIKQSGVDNVTKKILKAEVGKVNTGTQYSVKEAIKSASDKDKSDKQ